MRTLIGSLLVAVGTASPVCAEPTASDDRYKIHLVLNGTTPVQGSQEQAARLVGRSKAEQEAILNEPLPPIRAGYYQLKVNVTDPSGETVDHSTSGRLRFEGFGCLRVKASSGELTLTPSDASCFMPKRPSLWIVFLNRQGVPIAHNEYLFEVCDSC